MKYKTKIAIALLFLVSCAPIKTNDYKNSVRVDDIIIETAGAMTVTKQPSLAITNVELPPITLHTTTNCIFKKPPLIPIPSKPVIDDNLSNEQIDNLLLTYIAEISKRMQQNTVNVDRSYRTYMDCLKQ